MNTLSVTDAHVHFWQPDVLSYPWLEELPAIRHSYGPAELDTATEGISLSRMVFVQCECIPAQAMQEVEWVSSLATTEPRLAGIVAYAPIENPETRADYLARLAQNPLVRGIRRMEGPSDAPLCLTPAFIQGLKELPSYGLSFDICIKHHQLPETLRMVEQCPETAFMLDHFGKPNIANGIMEPWASQIRQLATFPNVWCKLSGLITEARLTDWKTRDLQPYFDVVLETFGPERIVFGGDWPVSVLAGGYAAWWNAATELLRPLSTAHQSAILHENAGTFYRL